MGYNMSMAKQFLHSRLDFIPPNLSAVSDEHVEQFHQDTSTIEKRYAGKWSQNMLADFFETFLKRCLLSVTNERVTERRVKRE